MKSRVFTEEERSLIVQEACKRAEDSFAVFLLLIYPQEKLAKNDYCISQVHSFLADLLDDIMRGYAPKNTAVSMPPQHGKSRLICVRFVAWLIGAYPKVSVAMTGFSHNLLTDFLKEVKALIQTERYIMVFGVITPNYGQNKDGSVTYSNGSSVVCKSAGSKLTGRRADILLIDDAHAGRKEAESKKNRKDVIDWYFADCQSRLSPEGKVFLIGTRWHPEDLIGHLTSEEYEDQLKEEGAFEEIFNVINFPALANHNPSKNKRDVLGRKVGQALFPEQRGKKFLRGKKALQPAHEWSSQYQGKPTTPTSGTIDVTMINMIDMRDVPKEARRGRGWDLAVTESTQADYTAGVLIGVLDPTKEEQQEAVRIGMPFALPKLFIIHVERERMVWTRAKERIKNTALTDMEVHNAHTMGMEAVSGFAVALSEITTALSGYVTVQKKNPPKGCDKVGRAQPWINLVAAGRVYMVRGKWNKDFKGELEYFPQGNHDDQVDGVSIAYETIGKKGSGSGVA